jgi:hypothetical protein
MWASPLKQGTGPADSLDVFNVTSDRTIMASSGVLYLSFDLLAA